MSKLNRRGAGKSRLNRPSRIGSHVNELSWLDERPEPDRVVKKGKTVSSLSRLQQVTTMSRKRHPSCRSRRS
ncbi:hypothetical protein LJK88_11565 [Paenibacillus sp. P26]|nr:hypothetical protein LJK88_11565 [Paenibacillus sp. P26]